MTAASLHHHPSSDQLGAYLQAPDAPQQRSVARHLIDCVECRNELSALAQLQSLEVHVVAEDITETQQQEVDDFVYGSAQHKNAALRAKIRLHPAMLKSALYALAQEATIAPSSAAEAKTPVPANWLSALRRQLHEFHAGWLTIPATALTTLVLVLLLMPAFSPTSTPQLLTAWQDDPQLYFVPASQMPGIGFFSPAKQRSQAFSGMKIKLQENDKLTLNWPVIEGAKHYRLTLYRFHGGKKTVLKSVDIAQAEATLVLPEAAANQRFEWMLTGETADNERFVTRGGFVLRSPHAENE